MSDEIEVSEESSSVTCDLCEGVKTPALKTCVKCEISMCFKHLQDHLTSSVLMRTHPLSKPVPPASTGQRVGRCSIHGKLLEYYCLDDRVLACMSCAIEDKHHLHNMKMLQTAHKELAENLGVKSKTLAERQTQSKELESWYKDQRQTLENCISRLTRTGSSLRDLVLTSVETSISARLGALETAQQAVRSALNEEDEFIFLQRFAGVHKSVEEACAVDLRRGLEEGVDRDKVVDEIRQHGQIIKKLVLGLQSKYLAFVDPENQQDPQFEARPSSELTFDPKTLGPGMTLSKDHKTLFYSPASTNPNQLTKLSRTLEQTQRSIASQGNQTSVTSQLTELSRTLQQTQSSIKPYIAFHHNQVSITPHQTQTVRCLQTNTTGSLRWMVRLSKHFSWTIGICDEEAAGGNYSVVYGLKVKNETLSSLQTVQSETGTIHFKKTSVLRRQALINRIKECPVLNKIHVTYPWTVEAIWDCTTQLLTFYSRNESSKGLLLLKLQINTFSHRLYPFITMETKTCDPQNRPHRMHMSENNVADDTSYTEILCTLSS